MLPLQYHKVYTLGILLMDTILLQYKLKILMLNLIRHLPLALNLVPASFLIFLIICPTSFPIIIQVWELPILFIGCLILWVISHALKYCIWHRLYIYLLLLFSITISIWFCDVVFIIHGALLLLLISLCIYFKKGLC